MINTANARAGHQAPEHWPNTQRLARAHEAGQASFIRIQHFTRVDQYVLLLQPCEQARIIRLDASLNAFRKLHSICACVVIFVRSEQCPWRIPWRVVNLYLQVFFHFVYDHFECGKGLFV